MRTFDDLFWDHPDLEHLLSGTVGELYVTPGGSVPRPGPLVRHFDTADIAHLVRPYAEIVAGVADWIAERPEVAELVEVLPLSEVGVDFVLRPFRPYYYALHHYDDPVEYDLVEVIPEELGPMRERVSRHLPADRVRAEDRESIIGDIVASSLLGPSYTTVMDRVRWVIVSPRLTLDQVERWSRAS